MPLCCLLVLLPRAAFAICVFALSVCSLLIPEYILRMFSFRQMDFDFAASQIVDLLLRPSELVKTTRIRKQIKNQWARDDPAFVILLGGVILLSTLSYAVAFGAWNPLHLLRLLLGGLVFEYLLCGCLLATFVRFYLNTHMRIQRIHAVEQSIEWLYAFDVHCNALLPAFLLVSTAQFLLLPILISGSAHTVLPTVLSNTLWLAGASHYAYITFLGYSALPFIDRPERLVYPLGGVGLLYLLLLLTNCNVSRIMLDLYFGHYHEGLEGKLEDALAMEGPA